MISKEEQKQDVWSHNTQKEKYDIYRPSYPAKFFQNILDLIPPEKRGSFLDIATGTGAFFFPLCRYFSKLSLGIDLSESQIEVASKKIDQTMKNVELKVMDVQKLSAYVKENNLSKFDLITIAEALHWIPDVASALKTIKTDLLAENGLFSIQIYICSGFEYNVKDQAIAGLGYDRYNNIFCSAIKNDWQSDREGFESGYATYPFKEIFGNVERVQLIEKHETSLSNFKGFLQTFSPYNNHCDKFSKNQCFRDPIETLFGAIEADLLCIKPEEFNDLEKPVKLVLHYFQINMKKLD